MNQKQPFIFTTEKTVADFLIKQGFSLLSQLDENDTTNNQFMFMNNGTLKFENEEDKNILNKMAYTNMMLF